MIRSIGIGVFLAIFAGGTLVAQEAPRPRRGPGPGKGPAARGLRWVNPMSPAARLMLATPAQRERALQDFAPERREAIRRQLRWFDSLPRPQQRLQIRRLERFAAMDPEERTAVRQEMRRLNQLPPERRQALRQALQELQRAPAGERSARFDSEDFRSRFSAEELTILRAVSDALLAPM